MIGDGVATGRAPPWRSTGTVIDLDAAVADMCTIRGVSLSHTCLSRGHRNARSLAELGYPWSFARKAERVSGRAERVGNAGFRPRLWRRHAARRKPIPSHQAIGEEFASESGGCPVIATARSMRPAPRPPVYRSRW